MHRGRLVFNPPDSVERSPQTGVENRFESIPRYLLRKARGMGVGIRHLCRSRAVEDFLAVLLFILFVVVPMLALTRWLFTH
jgi:hypothetical protein